MDCNLPDSIAILTIDNVSTICTLVKGMRHLQSFQLFFFDEIVPSVIGEIQVCLQMLLDYSLLVVLFTIPTLFVGFCFSASADSCRF
jgi:hypothetical protein